jgi:hypothetical protein
MPRTPSAAIRAAIAWGGGLLALCTITILSAAGAVHAQTSTSTLVYTTCGAGYLSACGEEVIGSNCTTSWGIDFGWITRSLGLKVNGSSCTSTTTKTLYRNFNTDGYYDGVCMTQPIAGQDATRTSPSLC